MIQVILVVVNKMTETSGKLIIHKRLQATEGELGFDLKEVLRLEHEARKRRELHYEKLRAQYREDKLK